MNFCQASCLLLLRHSLKERILLSPLSDEVIEFGSPQNQNSDIYIQIPHTKKHINKSNVKSSRTSSKASSKTIRPKKRAGNKAVKYKGKLGPLGLLTVFAYLLCHL